MKRLLTPAFAPLLLLAACDTKTEAPAKPAEPSEIRTVATSVSPTPPERFQRARSSMTRNSMGTATITTTRP
jgi:hypothetical protein